MKYIKWNPTKWIGYPTKWIGYDTVIAPIAAPQIRAVKVVDEAIRTMMKD